MYVYLLLMAFVFLPTHPKFEELIRTDQPPIATYYMAFKEDSECGVELERATVLADTQNAKVVFSKCLEIYVPKDQKGS